MVKTSLAAFIHFFTDYRKKKKTCDQERGENKQGWDLRPFLVRISLQQSGGEKKREEEILLTVKGRGSGELPTSRALQAAPLEK